MSTETKTMSQTQIQPKLGVKAIVQIGMLAAVAVILMLFELPLPFAPSFYKLDFSEVPVLVGCFAMGPFAGALIELVKILPDYSADEENISDVGTYKGGEYQNLIKQLNFKDSEENFYSVSIVTSLKQVLPQIKTFIMEVIFVIIMAVTFNFLRLV